MNVKKIIFCIFLTVIIMCAFSDTLVSAEPDDWDKPWKSDILMKVTGTFSGHDFQANRYCVDFDVISGGEYVGSHPFDYTCDLYSPCDGSVTGIERNIHDGTKTPYTGNYIEILTNDGYYVRLLHMRYDTVPDFTVGQTITKGTFVGQLGNSGDSQAAHLHFEVQKPRWTNPNITSVFGISTGEFWYGNTFWGNTEPNSHNYVYGYEAAHPHREYMQCSCGDSYYTGTYKHLGNCSLCTTSANIPNGTYAIRHTSSGKYASMRNTTENINTVLYQAGLGNGVLNTDQMLIFERQPDNSYSIKSTYSGKVLDVPSYDVGADVLQASWHGGDSQRWYVTTVTANGDYQLVNKCTGLTLDVYNDESADFTKIQQFNNHGGSAQRFRIVPVTSADIPNGIYVMENSELCVVPTYNADNGSNVFIWTINYFENGTVAYDGRWEFTRLPDNSYKIINVWRQEALDVQGAGTDSGTNVQVCPWWNHDAQHWYIIDCGGAYRLVAKHSGLALDVDGSKGPAAPLTNVQTWIINGTYAQQFKLIPATYAVTCDANGGMGAPERQFKTHGVALTLSTAYPTRAGYRFLGWATNASSVAAEYQPGGSYTTDSDITLYAVWAEETFQEVEYELTSSGGSLIRTSDNTISGSVSYNINKISSGTESGTVICGIYDNERRLVYVSMKQNLPFVFGDNPDSFTDISISNVTAEPYLVKIMAWDAFGRLEPLAAIVTFEL